MISVVVPFYNERQSVAELHRRLLLVLKKLNQPFEIIFVDDGSRDGTFEEMKKVSPVQALRLERNLGQTIALGGGVAKAKGEIIVSLDGDLENAPEDIPLLIEELNQGYDVVSGWRKKRWESQLFMRKIRSVCANHLVSFITRIKLHDHGSSLRAYRASVFSGITFSGEMHRMLAAYLGMNGARITEVPVSYTPRPFGVSKYGMTRIFRVLLDLFAFHFFRKYATRPIHFFGYFGFVFLAIGGVIFSWSLWLRVVESIHFNRTPLPTLVAIFVLVGFQFILMGLLAELLVRLRMKGESSEQYITETIEHDA